jgi:drug/metabolite transporter (DMT)-like permease
MREVGEVNPFQPLALLGLALRTIANPWVDSAMALLLTYTLLYMSALSWLDLSYLLPMTTSGYVLSALSAWLLLHEEIDTTRWAGTFTIAIGVVFIGLSDHRKNRQKSLKSSRRQGTCAQTNQDKTPEHRR